MANLPAEASPTPLSWFNISWYRAPLVLGAILVLLFTLFGPDLAVRHNINLPITQFVALGIAVLLAAAPLFACSVQTISRDRQTAKLDDVIIEEMKNTAYFQLARSALASLKPASINDPDYRVPLTLFSTIISFCSLLIFMSLFWPGYLKSKIFLLGGTYVVDPQNFANLESIMHYQSATLVFAGVAFLGAYLALFRRLLDQLNNNDIYPISFHYYSAWLIGSMIIACVFRHVASIFGFNEGSYAAMILISFAIGAAPAPFFAAFLHWAFTKLNITGDKEDPKSGMLPTNLNLLMIDGLANEKIDRLSELGITDAQVLSCQNPFTLWTRLPYDLALIVDWISQAQLYVCLRESAFNIARGQQIGDIHKFVAVLSDKIAGPDLCKKLGLEPSYVTPLLASLNENPSFVRLREVTAAMLQVTPAPSFPLEPSVGAIEVAVAVAAVDVSKT